MEESILITIKEMLGITKEYTQFDSQLVAYINSVFPTLRQLGVGPSEGFSISDDSAVWNDFVPEDIKYFESIKTYIYQKVKLAFDPPTTSSVIEAMNRSINEFEWRLNVDAETYTL